MDIDELRPLGHSLARADPNPKTWCGLLDASYHGNERRRFDERGNGRRAGEDSGIAPRTGRTHGRRADIGIFPARPGRRTRETARASERFVGAAGNFQRPPPTREGSLVDPVTCPSCGSKYNPETRELVEDTGLQARIRELEVASEIVRNASADLRTELDETKATLAEKETTL